MKKKFLAVLLAGAMTVSMLGGCDGPTGNNDKDGGGAGTAGGNTTADADGGGVGSETQAAGSIDSGTAGNPGTSTAGVNSEKSDETLTTVFGDEPASLLVEGTAGSNSTTIRMLLGDRLLDYDDEKGEFTGALLETWGNRG